MDGSVKRVIKDWPIFGDASIFEAQDVLGAAQIGEMEIAMGALIMTKGKLTHEEIESTLTGAGLAIDEIAASVNEYTAKISGLVDRTCVQAAAFNFAGTPT